MLTHYCFFIWRFSFIILFGGGSFDVCETTVFSARYVMDFQVECFTAVISSTQGIGTLHVMIAVGSRQLL